MKIYSLILLLTCFTLFVNFQCKDDPCALTKPIYVPLSAQINKEKYEYLVGDTIWISSEFKTKFPINNGKDTLELADGEGHVRINLIRLEDVKYKLIGYSDFKIINYEGEFSQIYIQDSLRRNYAGHILFNCGKEKCSFKVGLIPQKIGNYCFYIENGGAVSQDTSLCPPTIGLICDFNVTSYHREIFKELKIDWVNFPVEYDNIKLSENDGAYAFKVK